MVTERDPIYVSYDSGTPSSFNEFTAADVLPVKHGGTSLSSLNDINAQLGSLAVSGGMNVSSVSYFARKVYFTTSAYAAGVSATRLEVASSATISGTPYPRPFLYATTTQDGNITSDEHRYGLAGIMSGTSSMDGHISIAGTNDGQVDITYPGTHAYLLRVAGSLNTSGSNTVTYRFRKNGTTQSLRTGGIRNGVAEPHGVNFEHVFPAVASGDNLDLTMSMAGASEIQLTSGSSIFVELLR